ncbi:MAG: 3-phosphoshikimate 1-carboxyvinyltransferase [Propionibacteriaceae bacterium]|nr:3-phosphoshikimate 1-carboxyvinyltransferase [Propionibacteriaceae bacterium]
MASGLPAAPTAVRGTAEVPGSKSETNRALVLAALADAPSLLTGTLASRDSDLMIQALRHLGVTVAENGPGVLHISPPERLHGCAEGIDCGLAGTVMRFVPPVAALADGPTHFFGDPHASNRPMKGLLDALRHLGASVSGDALPFTLAPGRLAPATFVEINASASSQFISGLLLAAPHLPTGLQLRAVGAVPSRPHIAMTTAMLRARGVTITEPDSTTWQVAPGPIAGRDTRIEPDLTNAAAFLAAAAATGGSVTVPAWPTSSLQPGAMFLTIAEAMGCDVLRSPEQVTVSGPGALRAITVDLHAASELTPVVAALAALARGTSRITGVAHIRGHETDRLAALATELAKLGVAVRELPDGLEITGGIKTSGPVQLSTYADHRMVHFAAVVALVTPELSVDDVTCVGKTMPDFPERWNALVGV